MLELNAVLLVSITECILTPALHANCQHYKYFIPSHILMNSPLANASITNRYKMG